MLLVDTQISLDRVSIGFTITSCILLRIRQTTAQPPLGRPWLRSDGFMPEMAYTETPIRDSKWPNSLSCNQCYNLSIRDGSFGRVSGHNGQGRGSSHHCHEILELNPEWTIRKNLRCSSRGTWTDAGTDEFSTYLTTKSVAYSVFNPNAKFNSFRLTESANCKQNVSK